MTNDDSDMVTIPRAELERLQAADGMLRDDWSAAPKFEIQHADGSKLKMHVGGVAAQHFAGMFLDMMDEAGAPNYVEYSFGQPEAERPSVLVLVQRADGKTPNDLRLEAEAALEAMRGRVRKVLELEARLIEEGRTGHMDALIRVVDEEREARAGLASEVGWSGPVHPWLA